MSAWLKVTRQDDVRLIFAGGDWRLSAVADLERQLKGLTGEFVEGAARPFRAARLVLENLGALDTAGGWLLLRTKQQLERHDVRVEMIEVQPRHAALLARLEQAHAEPPVPAPKPHPIHRVVEHLGSVTVHALSETYQLLAFLGALVITFVIGLVRWRRLRPVSIVHHVEQVGLNAVPIVALLSFLIGVVLAYQGSTQLVRFGAEIFTIDLLGVSVVRELGVLLTAIIVAGRSGSAFTAQIGTMQVNEEVDAMRIMGLDPLEVLVMPRLLALMIALPLLSFIAIAMAIAGGSLVIIFALDIPTVLFLRQLRSALDIQILVTGLVKAPVFAFLIAMVGCYEGLRVAGSADSVGRQTTKAVVVSIFLVIVVDAVFSVVFAAIGV